MVKIKVKMVKTIIIQKIKKNKNKNGDLYRDGNNKDKGNNKDTNEEKKIKQIKIQMVIFMTF